MNLVTKSHPIPSQSRDAVGKVDGWLDRFNQARLDGWLSQTPPQPHHGDIIPTKLPSIYTLTCNSIRSIDWYEYSPLARLLAQIIRGAIINYTLTQVVYLYLFRKFILSLACSLARVDRCLLACSIACKDDARVGRYSPGFQGSSQQNFPLRIRLQILALLHPSIMSSGSGHFSFIFMQPTLTDELTGLQSQVGS